MNAEVTQRFWGKSIGVLNSSRGQFSHNWLCPTGTTFLFVKGSQLTSWPQSSFLVMLKSSPPFFAHHTQAKNGAPLKHRLEPGESYTSPHTALEERKDWSGNASLTTRHRCSLQPTRNRMGLFGGLYHSVDSLCEYLFFTILKMIIIIKVSS